MNLHAQTITLTRQQAPLKEILDEIGKQSGYKLLYNNRHLEQAKPVSVQLKSEPLKTALDQCMSGQPVTYEIINKTILIRPREAKEKEKTTVPAKGNKIEGKVINERGEVLAGASVRIKGTGSVAVTDQSGRFYFDDTRQNQTLVFVFVGYQSQEVPLRDQMIITLQKSNSVLDEAQVIAYGTTTKRLSTSAVSSVKAEDIERQPVSNPLAALQGRVPGLVITQTSGVPGASFKVQLRGQNSLDLSLSRNDPLFVIDGVPFESGNNSTNQLSSAANNPVNVNDGSGLSALNTINPQDIESIEVLKDADATSIYGSRGANGVILITTKKGKSGKTSVSINANTGFSRPGRMMEMLNTKEYLAMRREAFRNEGLIPSDNSDDPGYAPDIMLIDTTRYTDFKKLLIGRTARYSNYQASVSGGNNFTQFRLGGNYNKQTTVYPGDYSSDVISSNLSLSHYSSDHKFGLVFSGIYSSNRNNIPSVDISKYMAFIPNIRLYDDQGNLSWEENGISLNDLTGESNPLADLNRTYLSTNENLSANLNLSYRLMDGLLLKTNLGYNSFNTVERATFPSTSYAPSLRDVQTPFASFANSRNKSWIVEPQLSYDKVLPVGKLNLLAGFTFQNKSGSSNNIYADNYQSDLLLNSIDGAGTIIASNDASTYRYAAFFGRINYNFQDKYIINLTGRRDGSSRFGPERNWATFGAAGIAWIFTSEGFLKDKIPFLSFGKLRGSYGTTGNDQIGDYKYLNLWRSTPDNYAGIPGLTPVSLYNPEYNWEVNKKLEAALELGLFKERILFSSSYYRNRSSNQLVQYILPKQTGFSSIIRNFPGLVQNSGWEFTLNTRNLTGRGINWSSTFNISIPKNLLLSFPGLATSSYKNKYVEGKSLSVIKAYKYLGVDTGTGLYTFEDVDKDGSLNSSNDYQVLGNLDPKFYGGLQNNFAFNNFELSFFLQYSKQTGVNYITQTGGYPPGTNRNQPKLTLDHWRNVGDNSDIQKVTVPIGSPAQLAYYNLSLSDGAYTDASFIKLKNVSLSYRLPNSWIRKASMTSCRIYMQMENVLTFTGYKGGDPEAQNFYGLPPLRTVVAGIEFKF